MNQKQKVISTHNRDLAVRFLLAACVILILSFLNLPAQDTGTPPQVANVTAPTAPVEEISQIDQMIDLFTLETTRLVPGATIKVLVDKSKFDEKTWNIDEIALAFATTSNKDKENKEGFKAKDATISSNDKKKEEVSNANDGEKLSLDWYFKEIEGKLYLMAQLPGWKNLEKIKKQSKWRGIFVPYKADLEIKYHHVKTEKPLTRWFTIKIPDRGWILFWAIILSLLLLPLLAWPITRHFSIKSLALSVKDGSVSISKTQIVIWTVVVLFGIIYVYWVSEGFLDITPQILLLLGIGGGTAVTAKYIATKPNQNPAPGGAAGGAAAPPPATPATPPPATPAAPGAAAGGTATPPPATPVTPPAAPPAGAGVPSDFFKVQMLVFTVVIAVIVFKEIITTNAFPDLPGNYVMVMGISNAVYLGNKYQKS